MLFKVTGRYAKGNAKPIAAFNDEKDAKLFIEAKLAYDAAMNIKVVYELLEGMDVLQEFDPTKLENQSAGQSGGSAQSSSGSRMSPLSTSLKPPGMPKWQTDEDKKK